MAETKSVEFVQEVQDELKKVTWPDWPQLKNSTFVILVFILAIAALIFVLDQASSFLLDNLRGLLGS